MNKKVLKTFAAIMSGICLLTGCAKAPEGNTVKQKGSTEMGRYQEGTALADVETPKEGSRLESVLNAPRSYTNEGKDKTGKIKIQTDAVVEIPDAAQVSSIEVSQHPFDQAAMDRITDVFFPDAIIYSKDSYIQMTKDEWRQALEQLKGYVAKGEMDPYGLGTDENGSYYYDIYQEIETAEKNYGAAPEEKTLKEVHPQYGLEAIDGKSGSVIKMDDSFAGVVEMPDGVSYDFSMQSYPGMPMEVFIGKIRAEKVKEGEQIPFLWDGWQKCKAMDSQAPGTEELQAEIGMTLEEAKKLADEKVEQLELADMELTSWEYGLLYDGSKDIGYTRDSQKDAGYMLYYTRKINGIPVTYTDCPGGYLETAGSDMETWSYEELTFIITKDGIEQVKFNDQYDIGKTRTENLNLLPFEEIIEIYEKMMLIQNADVVTDGQTRTYQINRIAFGYSRIYGPSDDAHTGVLVPVWDFFGSLDTSDTDEAIEKDGQYKSYLTINAVDGSIIDRALGY